MSIKLVIADDAPFIREAMKQLLEGTEYECVAEATNGVEVVKLAEKFQPDIIIMDLVMPEKNGVQATQEILNQFPHMKIIACSSEGEAGLMLLALNAGCCHFLGKPFDKAELLKALKFVRAMKKLKKHTQIKNEGA